MSWYPSTQLAARSNDMSQMPFKAGKKSHDVALTGTYPLVRADIDHLPT